MLVLGTHGATEFPFQDLRKFDYGDICHDASAVLVHDGRVVAAIEEERLSRVKHTGKVPANAVEFCLNSYGVKMTDIDRYVIAASEQETDLLIANHYVLYDDVKVRTARDAALDMIYRTTGEKFPRENVSFVDHHTCHATSAYAMSGFNRSLILTIDGASPEGYAGYVISAEGDSFEILDRILNNNSLGAYYITTMRILGYMPHDEYKVMGLAPYGDPKRYGKIFRRTYNLLPEGKFEINFPCIEVLYDYVKPRKKGEPFTQEHKDLAAALQLSLETIVLHVLTYYRKVTGHTRLCMSGGVAHNCSMNGKVLYSGLFEDIFVQPAAHDGGNALGGALYVSKMLDPRVKIEKLQHLYWGTQTKDNDWIQDILKKWDNLISFKKEDNITKTAAKIIADGYVIGWVQGCSEFGPRALGNRSILADPRPAENKNIINAMVKKREGYRPFAPSVLEEDLGEYYEVPHCKAPFSYMNFVLRTKTDKWDVLGAVTHVDGSARVQTVSKATNEKYWNLINEFKKLTGIAMLLNTSFNNNVEPIVDSEEDAIVSFLTTKIHYLVIGDYLITKKDVQNSDYLGMALKRPVNTEMKKSVGYTENLDTCTIYQIRLHFGDKYKAFISEKVFKLLEKCDSKKSLEVLFKESDIKDFEIDEVIDEVLKLWSLRLVILKPK